MTSEVTQALLPCPFCGGKAERFTLPEDGFGNGGGDVITCSRCQASSHVEFGRKENLVDRWNTRLTAQSGEGRSGAGEEPGPFHVSQSGDGKKLWFSARDPASGVTIPARDRTDARNLVSSLNHACATFAALNARQSGEGEREAHLAIVECSDPNEGWSLSIKFGSGDHARDKMRALSDRLRAGEA